jgi:hypothetical protein
MARCALKAFCPLRRAWRSTIRRNCCWYMWSPARKWFNPRPHARRQALLEQITQRNLAAAAHYLEQLQRRLPPEAQTRLLVSDNVIASLHELVEQEKVDLVILSAHGHSGGSQRPYGNVVTNFITYGSVPLLIIQDMPSDKTKPLPAGNATATHSFSQSVGGQPFANANYAH